MPRRHPRHWPAALALGVAAGACTPAGDGGAPASPEERTRAAEEHARAGDTAPPDAPAGWLWVEPLRACSAPAARDAMSAGRPERRAAGAICAAGLPCPDAALDWLLLALKTDEGIAAEHRNRGSLMGSGDQRVSFAVQHYARIAIDRRRAACPSP